MKIDLPGKFQYLMTYYGRHVLVVFVAVLMVHDVFGAHGYLVMRRKQQEIQKVKAELDRLNKENAVLEQDRQDLKTDPATIEAIARTELHQSRPTEIIINLRGVEKTAAAVVKP